MEVTVLHGDVDKALKLLKRKLQQDGFFKEIKKRKHYDKPSVRRKQKQLEAEKRRRKAQRFRKDRD